MGLDITEVISLSDEVIDLGKKIGNAVSPDGPSGKKVTKQEALDIAKAALSLALNIVKEVAD